MKRLPLMPKAMVLVAVDGGTDDVVGNVGGVVVKA